MNFGKLFAHVAGMWQFTEEQYPVLTVLKDSGHAQSFKATHVHLHAAKSLGRVAGVIEYFDHRNAWPELSTDIIREASAKLIVNAVQLAAQFGISPEELEAEIFKGH